MAEAKIEVSPIHVRLAATQQEIEAAQALRYKVFYEEYGATADEISQLKRIDEDEFDSYADHLIVIDTSSGSEEIVGTYRMLRRDVVENKGQFYSSTEYDLSKLLASKSNLLELGRSCVVAEYRTRAILQMLWDGIAGYVTEHNIDLLFGCGSLHSTEVKNLSRPLSYMYHYHLAPEEIRVKAVEKRYINMDIIPKEELDVKAAFADLPPLIKGYLRIGATVGDGAVIDPQFNTTDVFIVMPTNFVTKRYKQHYERKTQKPLPGTQQGEESA